jgi:hypothetical protein
MTERSDVQMSVSSIELAILRPMSVKYVLKALAIFSGEIIFESLNFNSLTTVLLEERPSKLLIVFQACFGLLF